jgi:anti-sigma B factor antagonist
MRAFRPTRSGCVSERGEISAMELNVEHFKRVALVTVSGRVDGSTAPEFEALLTSLLADDNYQLVVNLADVDFMASAGLRALVSALRESREHGGDVRLCSLSERVDEVLKLAGLDTVLESFDDCIAAVGSF